MFIRVVPFRIQHTNSTTQRRIYTIPTKMHMHKTDFVGPFVIGTPLSIASNSTIKAPYNCVL